MGDHALAMEVQLQLCRSLIPPLYPLEALENLRRVRAEARANRLPDKERSAQSGIAMALWLLGEERRAISVARSVLADPIELKAEDAATAVLAAAIAHGRIGELDQALQLLEKRGVDLLKANAQTRPLLPARFAWARALVYWNSFILQKFPALWLGPSPEAETIHASLSAPGKSELIRLFDAADELLPNGVVWPYGRIMRMLLQGLDSSQPDVDESIAGLQSAATDLENEEPLASSMAWLYCSAVNFNLGRYRQALLALRGGYSIAAQYGYISVRRDLLLYESRIREAMSDYMGALKAHKELKVLRIRSLAFDDVPAQDVGPDHRSETEDGASPVVKTVAPRHVLRALKFIDEHVRERITVQAIVDHCQVSRRSLEIAFRQVRACTLAEYIKQTKLRAAAEELLRSQRPIQDIARDMGFSSSATFSREFSAQYGVPPSVWARRHRIDEDL